MAVSGQQALDILFVTGGSGLNASEQTLLSHFQASGHTVTTASQHNTQSSDADNVDLIFVSGACNTTAGSHFANHLTPAVVCGADGMKGMNLCGGGWNSGYGHQYGAKWGDVLQASHPVAGGLTGSFEALQWNSTLVWAVPGSGGETIISLQGDPNKALVYVYETGSSMYSGTAPSRRVGVYLDNNTATMLVSDGYTMLDAAMEWAANLNPNSAPVADFLAYPLTGEVALTVGFDGSYSTDPEGNSTILSYDWDFGDGSTGSGAQVNHTYTQVGTHAPMLTVTDDAGATHQVLGENIEVLAASIGSGGQNDPSGPSAGFSLNVDQVEPNSLVTFDASIANAPAGIVNYHWDFGDGTQASGAVVQHSFPAGVYQVTLTITDQDGQTDVFVKEITVGSILPVGTLQSSAYFLQRGGDYQLFNGLTLEDGTSIAMGITTRSERKYFKKIYRLNAAGNSYIITNEIKSPGPGGVLVLDTMVCQARDVPGLQGDAGLYVDCNGLDPNSYNPVSIEDHETSDRDLIAVRFDDQNNILWEKQFSSLGLEFYQQGRHNAITQTADGNIVISLNHSWVYTQPLRSLLVKLNVATGEKIWSRYAPTFGGDHRTTGLEATADGGFLATGSSAGAWTSFLRKHDANGDVEWAERYYDQLLYRGESVKLDGNGDAILNGIFAGSPTNIRLAKVDTSTQNTDWVKDLLPSDQSRTASFRRLEQLPNGDWMGIGFLSHPNAASVRNGLAVRFNSDLTSVIWSKSYEHPGYGVQLYEFLYTDDDRLLLAGINHRDVAVLEVNPSNGDLISFDTYLGDKILGTETELPLDIRQLPNGKIMLLTESNGVGVRALQFDAQGGAGFGGDCSPNDLSANIVVFDPGMNFQTASASKFAFPSALVYEDLPLLVEDIHRKAQTPKACPPLSTAIPPCLEDCPLALGTPDPGKNYVLNRTLRAEITDAGQIGSLPDAGDVHSVIAYYDGLGRPERAINLQASPDCKDVVSFTTYDGFGRTRFGYLPYNANTGGAYIEDPVSEALGFYAGKFEEDSPYPYSETTIEPSPLNRPFEQGAPGQDWQIGQHTIGTGYHTNSASFDAFGTYLTGLPTFHSYAPGELIITSTTDENGNETKQINNKLGQTLLSQSQIDANNWATTAYVYDRRGRVVYVIQPAGWDMIQSVGLSQTVLDEFAFQYAYDERNRIKSKKVPGADKVLMVYDELDREVASQDGNLRTGNSWLVTKYDVFSRPAVTGQVDGRSEGDMRTEVANNVNLYETFDGTNYSTQVNPALNEVYSTTYYDAYISAAPAYAPSTELAGMPAQENTAVKGLITGVRTLVLVPDGRTLPIDMSDELLTTTYYDDYGREIQTHADNLYINQTDIASSLINFAGETEATHLLHTGASANQVNEVQRMCYDHGGRLIRITHQLNQQDEIILASYEYDEFGQQSAKHLYDTDNLGHHLQDVHFDYNIRGWITGINRGEDGVVDIFDLSGENNNPDLFGLGLNYNNDGTLGTAMFNGNIAWMSWQTTQLEGTDTDGHSHFYYYEYDGLNRLTSADYLAVQNGLLKAGTQDRYSTSYSYDANGNIQTLQRFGLTGIGTYGLMDQLSYTYQNGGNSNVLTEVADAAPIISPALEIDNFHDGNAGGDYVYDASGNLTQDLNKGIQSIVYNHLNKPETVAFTDGRSITWYYDAAGSKLRQEVTGANALVRDYVGGYIYKDNVLEYVAHPEGRALPLATGAFRYEFNLTDHLGNVRVSFSDVNEDDVIDIDLLAGEVLQVDHYYPFGLRMGNSEQIGVENRFRYNGMELHGELGLNLYYTKYRTLDPTIGRWLQIDPKGEFQYSFSPYSGIHNNPIKFNDPNGDIAPAIWAAIVYALETGAETGVDIALGVTLSYLTGIPYNGWNIAADYFTNLIPGWGEIRSTKKVGDIGVALGKALNKFSKIEGGGKLFNQVRKGIDNFKSTGDISSLEKIRGYLYEFKVINSLDNVVGAGSNARQIAKFGGLDKKAGNVLNGKFGDVTFDAVQKLEDGALNLIEAKSGHAFSRARSFAGLNSKKRKQLTGKIDFAHDLNKAGGNSSVEFRFSNGVSGGVLKDITDYALEKGVNVKIVID